MKTVGSEGSVRMLKRAASEVKIGLLSNHLNASAIQDGVLITVAMRERRNRYYDASLLHSVASVRTLQ
jgi:hypothetical protein